MIDTTATAATSKHLEKTIVLVADAGCARLLLREANGTLREIWQLYAADDRVRALNQSPDTREVLTRAATPESRGLAIKVFVASIAERLRELVNVENAAPLVVIAPRSFGQALRDGFGSKLWKRVKHDVPRDEISLSDAAVGRLVEQTLIAAL